MQLWRSTSQYWDGEGICLGRRSSVANESKPLCLHFYEFYATSGDKGRAKNKEVCRRSVDWIQQSKHWGEVKWEESQSTSAPISLSILKPGWVYGNDRISTSLIGLTLHYLLDPHGTNKVQLIFLLYCSHLGIWVQLVLKHWEWLQHVRHWIQNYRKYDLKHWL